VLHFSLRLDLFTDSNSIIALSLNTLLHGQTLHWNYQPLAMHGIHALPGMLTRVVDVVCAVSVVIVSVVGHLVRHGQLMNPSYSFISSLFL